MHESVTIIQITAELAIQLGVILLAALIGGEIATRFLKLPAVLGHLTAGIIISPFALGGLIPFESGFLFDPFFIFDSHGGTELSEPPPVDPSIFFLAQLAAVVLLFEAGLETNRAQFIKYFRPATVVALGGVFVPFALGAGLTFAFGALLGFDELFSLEGNSALLPALFVGVAMTATSVGITARVLGEIGHLDSAEGVTVLSAAVVDDVLGIVLLAVVVGLKQSGMVDVLEVGRIFLLAFGFLAAVVVLGSLASRRISDFILKLRTGGASLSVALTLAILAAAVAEHYFGLAMIIGAYAIGLALSNTHLKERVEKPVHNVSLLLSPIFFVVIGMQVNFNAFLESSTSIIVLIGFAVLLSLAGIVSKLAGSGLPALGVGFNRIGALRVGTGMMPRGEVALIVAGIGIGAGVIDQTIFGIVVVMTVVTTVVAPPLLLYLFKRGGKGTRGGGGNPPKEEPAAVAGGS